MGKAKRKRELGKNIEITKPAAALERLKADAGKPMNIALIGAGLIPHAVLSGALMEKEATSQRHLFRYAFMVWDRIRTGEYDPWECTLCRKEYSGLAKLSVFGIIDRAIGDPTVDKPAAMTLVCEACDSVSTEETRRRIEQTFGLLPLQEGRQ